ncbi:unnamed protein product [Caretta caretta]
MEMNRKLDMSQICHSYQSNPDLQLHSDGTQEEHGSGYRRWSFSHPHMKIISKVLVMLFLVGLGLMTLLFTCKMDVFASKAHSSAIRPAPFSDHHLVTIMVSLRAESPGPTYWHFNNSLLEDESFVTSFREFWLAWREQWRAFPSVRRWWDLGKVRAKLFCREYTRGTSR